MHAHISFPKNVCCVGIFFKKNVALFEVLHAVGNSSSNGMQKVEKIYLARRKQTSQIARPQNCRDP
jgi:hypothetical protein